MGYELNEPVSLKNVFLELGLEWTATRDFTIDTISSLSNYQEGSLSFCNKPASVPANAILITDQYLNTPNCIYDSKPRTTFVRILDWIERNIGFNIYNSDTHIHPTAIIGANVVIESGCNIAENVVIEPNVVIHKGTIIGSNSRIRSCSSIGSDGFGFERLNEDEIIRFPHLGKVVLGKNVEVGSCTAISRGTLSDTIIHDNVKIDNLVHIAHNVEIKKGAFIIATSEISGSVEVGKNAWIAPNACVNQKVKIGDGAIVGLGSVVIKDVQSNTVVAGNPAKILRHL